MKKAASSVFFLISLATCYLLPATAWAQDILESASYRLQLSPFSIINESTKEFPVQTEQILPATGPSGLYVKTGFPGITTIDPFVFAVSPTTVAFDTLLPGASSIRTGSINIQPGSVLGFDVSVWEETPLSSSRGDKIPDADCESPTPCSGFGYSLSGDAVSDTFTRPNRFFAFPAKSLGKEAIAIMGDFGVSTIQRATITYRIYTDTTVSGGIFENAILFSAIPRY